MSDCRTCTRCDSCIILDDGDYLVRCEGINLNFAKGEISGPCDDYIRDPNINEAYDWREHSNYKGGLIEKRCIIEGIGPTRIYRTQWRWQCGRQDGTIKTIEANKLVELRGKVNRFKRGLPEDE